MNDSIDAGSATARKTHKTKIAAAIGVLVVGSIVGAIAVVTARDRAEKRDAAARIEREEADRKRAEKLKVCVDRDSAEYSWSHFIDVVTAKNNYAKAGSFGKAREWAGEISSAMGEFRSVVEGISHPTLTDETRDFVRLVVQVEDLQKAMATAGSRDAFNDQIPELNRLSPDLYAEWDGFLAALDAACAMPAE